MDTTIQYYEVVIIGGLSYKFRYWADATASIRMTYHMVKGVQFKDVPLGYAAIKTGGMPLAIALKAPKELTVFGQPNHL